MPIKPKSRLGGISKCHRRAKRREAERKRQERLQQLLQSGELSTLANNGKYSELLKANHSKKKKKRRVPLALHNRCIFKRIFGDENGVEVLANLQNEVQNNRHMMKMEILNQSNQTVISIVTPFMRRVHEKIKQSSEIVYMHSIRLSDSLKSHVYLLMTNSSIGGLPLGVIVTTLRTVKAISKGLSMIKDFAAESAFGGRGELGPRSFMIRGDISRDQEAVTRVFPATRILFCQSHLITTVRHYARDRLHIPLPVRATLLDIFKSSMLEETLSEARIEEIRNEQIMHRYQRFWRYLENLLVFKTNWASCYRTNLLTRGMDSNNLVKNAFLKLNYLGVNSVKSPIHLLKILAEDFNKSYADKITLMANYRAKGRNFSTTVSDLRKKYKKLVYFPDCGKVLCTLSRRTCSVDHERGLCSCAQGANGKLCEHLFTVMSNTDSELFLTLPETEYDYKNCYYIVTGKDSPDKKFTDWYHPSRFRRKMMQRESVGKVVRGMDIDQWSRTMLGNDTDIASVSEDTVFVDLDDIKTEVKSEEFTFEELDYVFTDLKVKISENPALCSSARKMLSSYHKITSINELESALFSFAK